MYDRFTDPARKVMVLANEEAQRFNHEYISTEHILLGLVKEGRGVAANLLKNLDVDLQSIRREVEKLLPTGPEMVTMDGLPQVPKAEKVIEYAMEESRNFHHNYVGTEHLLLGLLREQEGVAARVLINLGLKLEEVREELLMLLGEESQYGTEPDTPQSRHLGVSGGVTPDEHKADAPTTVRCAVITISDTRTLENDTGGQQILERLAAAGHEVVAREIIPDEPARMRSLLDRLCQRGDVEAILMTGGTGITSRDQTCETVSDYITKPLPGYGELFRMLSYGEIGPATILSRATGGLAGRIVLLTMPGSRAAVSLAMDKIILPELGHLVREARR